jgi:RimJ/RimL family protein N-acetyltransferase
MVNGTTVGYCGLSNISLKNSNAEYFILIGDNKYWNKGIGSRAGFEVMRYGFTKLHLHRIWLTVSECNPGAIKSYKKIGFKMEGRLRESCYRNGVYHDKIIMGMLSDEYSNRFL